MKYIDKEEETQDYKVGDVIKDNGKVYLVIHATYLDCDGEEQPGYAMVNLTDNCMENLGRGLDVCPSLSQLTDEMSTSDEKKLSGTITFEV